MPDAREERMMNEENPPNAPGENKQKRNTIAQETKKGDS